MITENQEIESIQPEGKSDTQDAASLELTGEIKKYMDDAGKWGKFLAILGFICMALISIAGIAMSIIFSFIPTSATNAFPFPPFFIGLLYLVMGAVYFFPTLYLYRFSNSIRQSLMFKNQGEFTKAFFNLKAFYRFIGILTIVILALYPILIIGMIIVGMFSGFSNSFGVPV